MAFHLHVYFDDHSRPAALALRERIATLSPHAVLGRVHEEPVAFHPRAMYQVAVSDAELGPVLSQVLAHRGELSVLVHPLHGDVWAEHIDDAMWIGPRLELDRARLRHASSAVGPGAEGHGATMR
ncbi:MAG: DOPA 4,5-dioxygenase family protein [Myxococcota bacterium]